MRDFVKSSGRWLRAGWFLPLLLLTVPDCAFTSHGSQSDNPPAFDGGPQPRTGAIMCDIPKVPAPGSDGCASSTETGIGVSQAHAAVALAQGEQSSIALDLRACIASRSRRRAF